MSTVRRSVVLSICSMGMLMAAMPSHGIPSWARKYKMTCSNCHFGSTNKLTFAGLKFQQRGYSFASDEQTTDGNDIKLAHYMSIASKVRYEAEEKVDPSTRFDVEALSIYSGGPIMDKFSYFFEIYLHERGKETASDGSQINTATRSKLAEAYLQYTSKPTSEDYHFVRAGQITPRAIYAASTGGRLSVNRPLIWNDNVGGGNLFTPRDRFYGVTAGTRTKSGFMAEVGVTNGGGGNARANQPEFNNAKDFFGSVSQYLDDYGSSVSLFGYSGTYPITGTAPYEDKYSRFALIGELVRDNFVISGAYSAGSNKNLNGTTRKPKGFYIEGGLNLGENDTLFARYDEFDYALAPKKTGYTFGISHRLNQVGRVVLEFQDIKPKGGKSSKKFTIELNWMF